MSLTDAVIVGVVFVISGFCIYKSLYVRSELQALRAVKAQRRSTRGDQDTSLLCLLDDDEKRTLLEDNRDLQWLGNRALGSFNRLELLWYAGYFRSKMKTQRYIAAVTASIGALFISRYTFHAFDKYSAVIQDPSQHLLPQFVASIAALVTIAGPMFVGFGGLAYGVMQKEKSDDNEFWAKLCEDRAAELR